MDNIVNMCDILLIQEHWLYDSHIHKIGKFGNGMDFCDKSSIDEYRPRRGSSHGVVDIVSSSALNLTEIECRHERLFGVLVNIGNNSLVIVFYLYWVYIFLQMASFQHGPDLILR